MVSVSCFKGVFCESDVGVFLVVVFAGYYGLVNNARFVGSYRQAGKRSFVGSCMFC